MIRQETIKNLKEKKYDLAIIGGGITGAGIALDAALRGLSVALVEKGDYASGTSSKSTKLIHGGLRYLKQFDFALVNEVGTERAVVHKLALNLVKAEKMLLPLYEGGTYSKFLISFGLALYDYLAGVKKPERRKMISAKEALSLEPLLKSDKLKGAGLYYEYRTDDARLTIEILKTAIAHGADCLNYCEVKDFDYDENAKLSFLRCLEKESGEEIFIEAEMIVNAAGPWVDNLRLKQEEKKDLKKHLRLTKGVHLVVDHARFPLKQSVYFDENIKGRMLFAIPRGNATYFGTTDTDYDGDLDDIKVEKDDLDYLLAAINSAFPQLNLIESDLKSSWAGLRPLIAQEGKSPSELSRKDEIFISAEGLISIAGGKLTGYRKMAERVVDLVFKKLVTKKIKQKYIASSTRGTALLSSAFKDESQINELKTFLRDYFSKHFTDLNYYVNHLFDNYGLNAYKIIDYFKSLVIERKDLKKEEIFILAELFYTLDFEYVRNAQDFWERRTGYLYFSIDTVFANSDLVKIELEKRLLV